MTKVAGYLQGNLEHHLDHLAPFCSLMGWPLIVTEEEIFQLCRLYYPDLCVEQWNVIEAPFEVTKQFDVIVTTLPRAAFDDIFFIAEATLRKRLKTIWLPHGNSDKGHLLPWMEALSSEEMVLVYGPKMIDFLALKQALSSIQTVVSVGNFRWVYFQKHRQFYETLLADMGLKGPFILYAPTWKDAENSSSFEMAVDAVIEELGDAHRLVIKPHPNQSELATTEQRKLCYSSKPRLTWLDRFPPIYPLLEQTSHLLGDFSSIGYDFLRFNRPMFFFNKADRPLHDPGRFLHRYGTMVSDVSALQLLLALPRCQEELTADRQRLYTYTFGEEIPWELTSKRLLEHLK